VIRIDARRSCAAGAVLVPFLIYALSISPHVAFWDTGEMATVPYLYGIAHPTCFPAFVLAGWLTTHLVPFGTIAWRTSLVASAGGAAAAGAIWLLLVALDATPPTAMFCAWIFAFGQIVWVRSSRAEVHALLLGFEALALGCAAVFARRGGLKWAIGSLICEGFALATHPNALWILPGIAAMLAARGSFSPRVLAQMGAALGTPLLLYLTVLLRSMWLSRARVDPTLAIGLPPGQPFWNYGDPSTIRSFIWMISGQQWNTRPALISMVNPLQYLHGLTHFATFARAEHGPSMIVLAIAGFVALAVRTPAIAIGLALAFLGTAGFASAYTIESDQARYLLCALWLEIACVGALLAAAEHAIRPRWLVPSIAFLLAASTLWMNRGTYQGRSDPGASLYIARVRAATGPRDTIVAPWVYVTPLGYARYAEKSLADRIPVNAELPQAIPLLRELASARPTDLVLEKPMHIAGLRLVPLDRGSPGIYRAIPVSRDRKKFRCARKNGPEEARVTDAKADACTIGPSSINFR
jgi:hypothetical protein